MYNIDEVIKTIKATFFALCIFILFLICAYLGLKQTAKVQSPPEKKQLIAQDSSNSSEIDTFIYKQDKQDFKDTDNHKNGVINFFDYIPPAIKDNTIVSKLKQNPKDFNEYFQYLEADLDKAWKEVDARKYATSFCLLYILPDGSLSLTHEIACNPSKNFSEEAAIKVMKEAAPFKRLTRDLAITEAGIFIPVYFKNDKVEIDPGSVAFDIPVADANNKQLREKINEHRKKLGLPLNDDSPEKHASSDKWLSEKYAPYLAYSLLLNWSDPLPGQMNSVKLLVNIDVFGKIIAYDIKEPSKSGYFQQTAIKRILASGPFQPFNRGNSRVLVSMEFDITGNSVDVKYLPQYQYAPTKVNQNNKKCTTCKVEEAKIPYISIGLPKGIAESVKNDIIAKVPPNWKPSLDTNSQVDVAFRVMRNGVVSDIVYLAKSANENANTAAYDAVQKSKCSAFPAAVKEPYYDIKIKFYVADNK